MLWIEIFFPLIIAAIMLIIPGTAVTVALGLKGFNAIAIGSATSISIYVINSIILDFLNIRWHIIPNMVIVLIITALAYTIRKTLDKQQKPQEPWLNRNDLTLYSAVLLGGTLIALQLKKAFVLPNNFGQNFDNIFHLNAIRYIEQTGSASPFTISNMVSNIQILDIENQPHGGFYPIAWHSFVSLIFQHTNIPITAAPNIAAIIIACILWPMSCLYLIKTIKKFDTPIILVAGILTAGFTAYPLLLLSWGILYPNFLGVAILPLIIALYKELLLPENRDNRTLFQRIALFLILIPGLTLAHPNTLISFLVLILPIVFTKYYRYLKNTKNANLKNKKNIKATILFALYMSFFLLIFIKIRPPIDAGIWKKFQTESQGIGEILLNSPMLREPAWIVSLFSILGIIYCIKNKIHLWLLGVFFLSSLLFFFASSSLEGDIRDAILMPWYKDNYRLAALTPIGALPFAVIGSSQVIKYLSPKIKKIKLAPQKTATINIVTILAIAFFTQGNNITNASGQAREVYAVTNSNKVNSQKEEVLNNISKTIPQDSLIAVNSHNGGAFAYAISGINTTEKHIFNISDSIPEIVIILEKLNTIATNKTVCQAVKTIGITHVIDFGSRDSYAPLDTTRSPGFVVKDSHGFKPIITAGGYGLYEILPCDSEYSITIDPPLPRDENKKPSIIKKPATIK